MMSVAPFPALRRVNYKIEHFKYKIQRFQSKIVICHRLQRVAVDGVGVQQLPVVNLLEWRQHAVQCLDHRPHQELRLRNNVIPHGRQ